MKKQIVLSAVLLVLGFGILTPQFAQDRQDTINYQRPDPNRTFLIYGFLRTINTAEVQEFSVYRSYGSWRTLLAHQSEYFNGWRTAVYPKVYPQGARFGELPEILPGLNLRLSVDTDGQGYDLLLEDITNKTGYAVQTDESAVIRECWPLQPI